MKLFEIFRYELAYQLRRPITWLFFTAIATFAYLNTGDDSVADKLYEDFFLNSPFAIAQTTVVGTMIWLVMAAVIAGSAAARDIATRIHPLTYSTPIRKVDFLGGRFLAAFLLNALLLIAVQIGIIIAIYSPKSDPNLIGPFGAMPYITAYSIISLPNAFFATSIQFWLASRSGKPMSAYFGSFLLFFMGFFVAAILLFYQRLGSLVDPIGIRYIIEDLAHAWTPTERRSRLLSFEGSVLVNRLVWFSIGLIILGITYIQFRFDDRSQKRRWWHRKKQNATTSESATQESSIDVSHIQRQFGFITQFNQMISLAWSSFKTIATSRIGIILIVVIPLLALIIVRNNVDAGSVPRIPITSLVVGELTDPLTFALSPWVIIPLLLVIFAGEIVWRDREARTSDIIGSMPIPAWTRLVSKFFAMALITAMFMALLTIGGIFSQLTLGYTQFEVGLYLKVMFGLQFTEYILFAWLVIIIHVIVNHKYIAHLVVIVVAVFIGMPSMFSIGHSLLVFGAGPQWSHSEMRGFGASLAPWMWFKLYWAAWIFFFTAFVLSARRMIAIAAVLVIALGGFIFYNTNIVNHYLTKSEYNQVLAEYEQRYSRYQRTPQPSLMSTKLNIEMYPDRGAADIQGTYSLLNKSGVSIDTILVAIIPGAKKNEITFGRPVTAVVTDDQHGQRIYKLASPLQIGDSLQLQFEVGIARRGFGTHGIDESIVANGSFFNNTDWMPAVGYQSRRELKTANDRREYGLPAKALVASLYDTTARMISAERTTLDIVIGTNKDQIAVAPGLIQKTWTTNDRQYFQYKTDGPIDNTYPLFSSVYDASEFQWKDVSVKIFHHPTHTNNIERMKNSITASMDHYTNKFGPYPHRHLTMVEVRGNEIGMHADESIIRFAEGTALWDPGDLDLPYSVVSHELAHQWWGHQLEAAFAEGAPILSESLAQYSAMQVLEETHGRDQLRRMLTFMRQPFPYAPIHHGEPLLRGIDPYLSYRKGPFVLQALSENIGTDSVEMALHRLLEKHPKGKIPLATTLDLYEELKTVAPDSAQHWLHDMFEVNTWWQLRMESSEARLLADSTWQVTINVTAHKSITDESGQETVVPIDEWIEIGVFPFNGRSGKPIYLQKHRIASDKKTIVIILKEKPAWAGIDPYHILEWDEKEDDDNFRRVKIGL